MTAHAPRAKIPVRLPLPAALALLGAMAAVLAYAWPLLLTPVIRRNLRGPARYVVSFAFAALTLGFATYCALEILPASDQRVVYRTPLGFETLYVVPALFAWGAAALGWAGVGGVGSKIALLSGAAWGLKPIYAGWGRSTDFWSSENPHFYGAGAALVVVALLLVVVQVFTLRERRPSTAFAARAHAL